MQLGKPAILQTRHWRSAFGGGGNILDLELDAAFSAPLIALDAARDVAGEIAPLRERSSNLRVRGPEGDGADLASIHGLQRTAEDDPP